MFTKDKHFESDNFANITDNSAKRPEGYRSFFAFVRFEDNSECLLSNIFAVNRLHANSILHNRFADCLPYMAGYSLQETT